MSPRPSLPDSKPVSDDDMKRSQETYIRELIPLTRTCVGLVVGVETGRSRQSKRSPGAEWRPAIRFSGERLTYRRR
jgi:hypothetical protein